jgi:putative FmdB family regulatory protein
MPFYEYQCKACGHALEAMQKVNDSPLKKCPHCGKSQLTRLMSAPVFRLKGGGWYETDFKGEQDNKKNLADRPDQEAAKPKEEVKAAAEAKPAEAGKDAAKPEKTPDKPSEQTAAKAAAPKESATKPASPRVSKRGAAAAPAKAAARSTARKAIGKAATKTKTKARR